MPPVLFLCLKDAGGFRILSRLGFPMNYHIKYDQRDAITREVLLSANRIAVEIYDRNEEEINWLKRLVQKARYHGIETHIITTGEADITSVLSVTDNILLVYAHKGEGHRKPSNNKILAVYDVDVALDIGTKAHLIVNKNAWDPEIAGISNQNVLAISAYVDELITRDDVLIYDAEKGGFSFIDASTYMDKYAESMVKHLMGSEGVRSIMLSQVFRFIYEWKYGDEYDKKDATIGLSIINLYLHYEV